MITIHRPVRVGTVGKRDSWGYGSVGVLIEYPTLRVGPFAVNTTTGGVNYPAIEGVRPTYSSRSPYAPHQFWCQYDPTWTMPDGRVIRAIRNNGEDCLAEESAG